MTTETATIIDRKLCILTENGSVIGLGIRQARKELAHIEASPRDLKPATIVRRDALRAGIALWDAKRATDVRKA